MNLYRITPEDTFLLFIDLQERMLPSMADADHVAKNAEVLLETAKAFHLPMIVTEQYPKGLGATVSALQSAKEQEYSKYAEKTVFNAITPAIHEALSEAPFTGRKQVIVTGIEAHICVFQTVRTLLAEGYHVFIPADAVSSRDARNKERALALFTQMGAVVTSTESLLFDLLGDAKNPHFKALQALIK